MKNYFPKQLIVFSAVQVFIFILSCSKYKQAVVHALHLDDDIPAYTTDTLHRTNTKIHQGRVLSFDKALSLNNSIECVSCHRLSQVFADKVTQSAVFENRLTKRNSKPINLFG